MTKREELPDPPVPPDLDLRDFRFMPLEVSRLRDSETLATLTDSEFRAAVLLWCASWHQVPASSLPANDRALAQAAGFGRDVEGFLAVKDNAMRHFFLASDGRLYHPVVAEKAVESAKRKRGRSVRARAGWERRKEREANLKRTGRPAGSKPGVSGDCPTKSNTCGLHKTKQKTAENKGSESFPEISKDSKGLCTAQAEEEKAEKGSFPALSKDFKGLQTASPKNGTFNPGVSGDYPTKSKGNAVLMHCNAGTGTGTLYSSLSANADIEESLVSPIRQKSNQEKANAKRPGRRFDPEKDQLTEADIQYAAKPELGFSRGEAESVFEDFATYFTIGPGRNKTWANWTGGGRSALGSWYRRQRDYQRKNTLRGGGAGNGQKAAGLVATMRDLLAQDD